jgi:hypothetical protein
MRGRSSATGSSIGARCARIKGPSSQAVARRACRRGAAGQPFHLRELSQQVSCQPSDDPAAPALIILTLKNRPTDGPVQLDELGVDGPQCMGACGSDTETRCGGTKHKKGTARSLLTPTTE